MKAQFAKRMAAVLCAALLCAACLCAQPRAALAAEDYTMDFSQDAFVSWSGTPVNYSNTDARGAGWRWTSASKTLTLSGLNFETSDAVALKLPAGATLVLAAGTSSTVTSTLSVATAATDSYGVLCLGALTITGGGSLTATGGSWNSSSSATSRSIGLCSGGVLTVSGNARLVGIGRAAVAASMGISVGGNFTVKDNASVMGQGGSADGSVGVAAAPSLGVSVTVSDNATLRGTGGPATANSMGIITDNGLHATGGTVVASGNTFAVANDFDLSGYANYQWRTSATGAFTASATRGYTYSAADTYVEVQPNLPHPATGDGAPLALWAGLCLLAGAGTIAALARRRGRNAA